MFKTMTYKGTVSERVKVAREMLNQTQKQFYLKAEMSATQLSRIENGDDPSDATLSKISTTFNVRKEWLKTGKGEMFNSGLVSDNIDRANSIVPGLKEMVANPWKDALVAELKDEVNYLRELLKMAMGNKAGNFLKTLEFAGLSQIDNRSGVGIN